MKSPRHIAALALAFGLLAGLALWLSYRRSDSAAPKTFVASEKVKAKLQAMRQELAARLKQTNQSAQRASAKPLNALAATAVIASSQAPTYEVAENPALESEAEDLGGIEIPHGEDARAQIIRTASRAAQDEARQRFERIKKLYPFIPNAAFDKRELVKKELRETNPDIRQVDDWRAVLRKLPQFQWNTYQNYVNVHDQGRCNQCWAFAAMAAYEANVRVTQALGGVVLDPSIEPEALAKAPLPPGFTMVSDWTMRPDKFEICRELGNHQNQPEQECRPVSYGTVRHPPLTASDEQVRQLATQVITARDACDATGWHGTAFNHMLALAVKDSAYREVVAWGYVNYPPSQTPSVEQLKVALLEHGPVVALVYMDKYFQGYKSGVFNEQNQTEVNHAVLLTGWDDEKKAWRIQNSFGLEWGEDGHMWIAWGSHSIGKYAAWLEVQ